MQFKHPEILYFLGLLIIPIVVHLFQLQRFEKVPFTNVAFLKKLVLQTRKSSQLKKWLILTTRLLLLTGLIIAFSQPYFSNKKASKKDSFLIYLDNSLSLSAKGSKGDLLVVASQEIIENLNKEASYSLVTNDNFYNAINAAKLKELLLKIKPSSANSNIENTLLKINNYNTTEDVTTLLISDFQNANPSDFKSLPNKTSVVQIFPELKNNISIDSVSTEKQSNQDYKVSVFVRNQGVEKENVPISIFYGENLINKQTFSIEENSTKTVTFLLQQTATFLGKILVNTNDTYSFDNSFFFAIDTSEKTNVLAIGNDNDFLKRIYAKDEFNFKNSSLNTVNYNSVENQQLVILNQLDKIPNALANILVSFSKKGGNLVVIPSNNTELTSYNSFFKNLRIGTINTIKKDSLKITAINYDHPVFKGVFEKRVRNFSYPSANSYFESQFTNASNLISFENQKGFIKQIPTNSSNVFWVASPLTTNSSNFINSPLVVPTFYNIGILSLQHPELFFRIGKENGIEVSKQLKKDEILTITNAEISFIPLQQAFQNKVRITTTSQPFEAGMYSINHNDITLKPIAYNYTKEESNLTFLETNTLTTNNNQLSISKSIPETLKKINDASKVHWLWKWFLGLAIVSLLLEILILKFFKP